MTKNTPNVLYFLLLAFNLLMPAQTLAAERIFANYAVVERSISVASLEAYAKQGILDEDLAVYAQYATPEQLEQLRNILLLRADVNPVIISQFLYTPQGEIALQRLGEVIKTGTRQPGLYAIRAALILAASDSEGLTLLNFLKKFPTEGIRIDLTRASQIARELQQIVNQTNQATALINRLSTAEAAANPFLPLTAISSTDLAAAKNLPLDLSKQGPVNWTTQSINISVQNRTTPTAQGNRVFPVDLYIPQGLNQPAPVIVISHGLGSARKTFQYLAEHLASYGFFVAVPQHPGSDVDQLQALINGTASEVAEPTEFLDRPLDIKYLLDSLTSLEKTDFSLTGKLNLQQVGVVGQSFGGYTALALAGAPIDFQELQKDCELPNESWNISLLLQCRAQILPPAEYSLNDSRIKAIIAINPINSSVLGQKSIEQIKVPVMLIAGSADTAAPALPEQIEPFTWLKTINKYLVLINNSTHFSTLAEADLPGGGGVVPIPSEVIGPSPSLARRYVQALGLAFFQTYLANREEYRPYLQASYAKLISREPMPLSLIQSLTAEQLLQAFQGR
ncbi:alpha/beta hydrolase [Ancylothrix sp. C2]|uniref:alpha/beta hydrolase n=1 Tax=Ancylothrix sp. D3o TaxID=2953691 RepID=UPI0021BA4D47|nr:alpha/beta hydrolase [Ancylothrix sp. D3o]MCT7950560.1 alpha/beta hydrolase [Ancylothrix sp. D3o]